MNYPLNVSLFKLFSNDSRTLQPKVKHPCNPARNLILLFDIVHIIKSIHNNWLNLHDHDKTFVFPLFEYCFGGYSNYLTPPNSLCVSIQTKNVTVSPIEHPSLYPQVCTAPFEDIRSLFKSDVYNILKRAPKLSSKACWPSKLERQNVNLALKIFHESTYYGLLTFQTEKEL